MAEARYNYLKEAHEALKEIREANIKTEAERAAKAKKEAEDTYNEIQDLKEHYEFLRERDMKYKEKVRRECLSTSLKAIYISALQESMDLTDENIRLANSLVENFIDQEGGADAVLRKMSYSKSYLLETMRRIVEDTEEEVVDKADEEQKDFEEVPDENKEKLLDKMEKEEDVDSAVEIIANRISAAEEDFIKKNAEDKKKIEDIVSKVNDRIEAVKSDITKDDDVKEEIEQEAAIDCRRAIDDVYNRRDHSLFEHMVKEMSTAVVKDPELKKMYLDENGKLDMGRIYANTKCMYGFLEFVNTVGLQKVNEQSIKEMVESM